MRYQPRNLLLLAGSSLGRRQLSAHIYSRSQPLLEAAAGLHRRTFARGCRIVAVVGSFGKTTTTAAVAAALGAPILRAQGKGMSGIAMAILKIRQGQERAVLEVGIDRKGQMARHGAAARPDIVVVTAIGSEHNGSLGSLDETRDEKAIILQHLRSDGVVVLNGDDPRVRAMATSTHRRILTFGYGADNDVRASDRHLEWPHGTRLKIHVGGATYRLRVRLLGRVMTYPILAAIAVAWVEGRPLEDAVSALEALPPQPGRLQLLQLANGAWVIRDEFKSTLETIDAALDVLAEVPGRRILVLGDISEPPGSQGPHYRRIGARLATIASRVIVVGAKQSFQRYAAGAARAGLSRTALAHAESVHAAVAAVETDLRPGDVVLVKGRDTQRLDRVALKLQGRRVACNIDFCRLMTVRCATCPILSTGGPSLP